MVKKTTKKPTESTINKRLDDGNKQSKRYETKRLDDFHPEPLMTPEQFKDWVKRASYDPPQHKEFVLARINYTYNEDNIDFSIRDKEIDPKGDGMRFEEMFPTILEFSATQIDSQSAERGWVEPNQLDENLEFIDGKFERIFNQIEGQLIMFVAGMYDPDGVQLWDFTVNTKEPLYCILNTTGGELRKYGLATAAATLLSLMQGRLNGDTTRTPVIFPELEWLEGDETYVP